MNIKFSGNCLFLILAFLVFIAGIWLRTDSFLSKALEYDEIWTLESYAGATNKVIFTDLGLPNNHPLNSLLIKYSLVITGYNNLALGIRLNSLIAGILTILLVGAGAYLITGKAGACFLSIVFAAFNGGLIHYSQTGRGYSMQTFLVVAFVVGLILYQQRRKHWTAVAKLMMSLLLALIAILAMLTLSTSVLFIFPVCCLYIIVHEKGNWMNTCKDLWTDKYIMSCFLLVGCCALYWYLSNFSLFRQGQGFGSSVNDVSLFFNFALQTLTALIDWKLLLLIIPGLAFKSLRIWIIMFLSITGFVLVSALIFKAGPARTYLPLTPLICITAAGVVAGLGKLIMDKTDKKIGYAFFVMTGLMPILSLPANLDFWEPPDWKVVFNKIKELPANYYFVYPLNESYPLWFNNKPDIIKDIYIRAGNVSGNSFFVSVSSNAAIQGKRADGSQLWIKLSETSQIIDLGYKNLQSHVYRLRRPQMRAKACGKIIVAYISIQEQQSANALRELLWKDPQNEWLLLNEWLNCPFSRSGKQFIAYFMVSEKNHYAPSDLNAIEENSRGQVHFFYLDSFKD